MRHGMVRQGKVFHMRHDRSRINEKGGVWVTIADAVYAQTEAIVRTGRPITKPAPSQECDELAKRRVALGLGVKEFARASKLHPLSVYKVECGTSGAEALRRYRAALEQMERG